MKSTLFLILFTFCLYTTKAQRPFITTWDTRNTGISDSTQIIFYATGDNFHIGWVNTIDASDTGNIVAINGADTITFPAPGIYKVYIAPGSGSFSAITLAKNNDVYAKSDGNKLLSIEQWGDINWSTFKSAFASCKSMVLNATDVPNLSNVTDMSSAFFASSSLTTNGAMNSWDVSNVTDMHEMFRGTSSFNQPLDNWNVNNVTNMAGMFSSASNFNQSLDSWNVSNVTNMAYMFQGAINFNQPISNWNVSNVTDMHQMFNYAFNFNQPIGNWDISNVTDINAMFGYASNFNQPIGNWDVSNVTDISGVFGNATNFNQPIGNWNVSNVKSMQYMFFGASSFNQPIENWNVSNVLYMFDLFHAASSFNQPLNNWNVSNVQSMQYMFNGASSFNQPIDKWNVSNVYNMYGMFWGASNFNQSISDWNVGNVLSLDYLFSGASSFNQSLGNWKLNYSSTLLRVNHMLDYCGMDCGNYSATLRGWAANPAIPKYKNLGAAGLTYDSAMAKAAHDSLVNIQGWTITGDAIGQCSVLPITLLSFTAKKQNETSLLNWQTANEINNNYFSVERSKDSKLFIEINKQKSKGNSSQTQSYTFTDNKPFQGWNYYRLKQVDNDGKFSYSSVASVFFDNVNNISIYPNPAKNYLQIDGLKDGINSSLNIVDANGKNVITTTASTSTYTLNIQNLTSGVYYLTITQDGKTIKEKFIK